MQLNGNPSPDSNGNFLNPPKDYEGGTSFSQNKEAKFERTIGKPFFEIEFISSDGTVDTQPLIIAE